MCTHFCSRPARRCLGLPRNAIKIVFCCPCQLLHPSKQLEMGHPQILSRTCHPFSHAGKTDSRTLLASCEWLAALSNVLPCLCLKLVLRQEYLTAGLSVLPVFKLSLVVSGYMCLCKGRN